MNSREVLRRRRHRLQARTAAQRLEVAMHAEDIRDRLAPVDRGLGFLRQIAAPPVLLGAGIVLTLVLGRGRTRRLLGGGIALAGLALRWRGTVRILLGMLSGVSGQVSSSGDHGGAMPGTSASRARTR